MCEAKTTKTQRPKSFGGHKGPHNKRAWKNDPRNSLGREKNGLDPCSPTVILDLTQNCPQTETKGELEIRGTSHPSPHQDVLQLRGRSARNEVKATRTKTVLGFCTSERDVGGQRVLQCPSHGCLLFEVLILPAHLYSPEQCQAASHPKSHLKGMKLDQDTPFWMERKQSKSTSAPLLLMACRFFSLRTSHLRKRNMHPAPCGCCLTPQQQQVCASRMNRDFAVPSRAGTAGPEYSAQTLSASHTSSPLCSLECTGTTVPRRERCLHSTANAPRESQGLPLPHTPKAPCLSSRMRSWHCVTPPASDCQ